ncbi:uncharacterized protein LOC121384150 [Gigantopelta aegis]|uniref:uncharacterized protein LOC121384150 n=1 Tax=Gigantopelta aegis TaxID=1735272 RepID=UPI001B88BE04|nr:uncharacterized protein LOC121384150 [Gigantopelta aegis]
MIIMARNCILVFGLFISLLVDYVSMEATCSFDNEECSYHIKVQHVKGNCVVRTLTDVNADGTRLPDDSDVVSDTEYDIHAKMQAIQETLGAVKDEHEKRLKDLEASVRQLLGLKEKPLLPFGLDHQEKKKKKGYTIFEDGLLARLESEFYRLREMVKRKDQTILDTELKLNESQQLAQNKQVEAFALNRRLLHAEHKVALLERERRILKNQLKDKTYLLRGATHNATATGSKMATMEEQLLRLVRSESTLREVLMTCQLEKNHTEAQLAVYKHKASHILSKQKTLKGTLRIRESELIDCYSAKTQSFCGFEDPYICGFTQETYSDFFNWTRVQGKTPSGNTGPGNGDHTCGTTSGHFMYIEASAKGRGNNAIMYSPLYRGMDEQCIAFFYNMNGRNIGTLNVYAKARGAELFSVWRAYGNQGDVWSEARLGIPKQLARAGYQIAFEGITESGYQGDISIDDVTVTSGACKVDSVITSVKVAVNSTILDEASKAFARKIKRGRKSRKRQKKRT